MATKFPGKNIAIFLATTVTVLSIGWNCSVGGIYPESENTEDELISLFALIPPFPRTSPTEYFYSAEYADLNDGTIRVVNRRYGEDSPEATWTIYLKKCLQGRAYNAATGACEGSPALYSYCPTNDLACKGNWRNGYYVADPVLSPASASCAAETLGGKTWTMLLYESDAYTYDEKIRELLLLRHFNVAEYLSLVPDLPRGSLARIWTGTTPHETHGEAVFFENGKLVYDAEFKSAAMYVLCMSKTP